jgi:hypothetical protein
VIIGTWVIASRDDPDADLPPLRRHREALPTGTTFVDHLSIAVMARERIDAVFALSIPTCRSTG